MAKNRKRNTSADPKEIVQTIESLPEQKKAEVFQIIATRHESYSMQGMLPARVLQEFEGIIENGPERVFSMIEEQGKHRRSIESKYLESNNKQSERGQIFAFSTFIIAMIASIALILNEYQISGIAGLFTSIASLMVIYVYGKKAQSE